MRDTIYREEAIKKIAEHLGVPAENWMKIAEEWIKDVPSAAQPEERALHESCTDCPLYDKNRNSCPRFNKVIPEVLREVQPEQRWIPCSEETGDGYPEEDGYYYVTEQNYGFYLDADCKQRVAHTSHFKNGDFTDRFYTENNSNITAWMPLPEPYEGRKDDI